jgi:hypothetical protein
VEESEPAATKKRPPPPLPRWTIFKPDVVCEEYGSGEELRREYEERHAAVEEAIAYGERGLPTSD